MLYVARGLAPVALRSSAKTCNEVLSETPYKQILRLLRSRTGASPLATMWRQSLLAAVSQLPVPNRLDELLVQPTLIEQRPTNLPRHLALGRHPRVQAAGRRRAMAGRAVSSPMQPVIALRSMKRKPKPGLPSLFDRPKYR